MIYETKKYVDKLIKLKITPSQFLLCWLLYNKQWNELKAYMNEFGSFSMQEIRDLIDKDLILDSAPKNKSSFEIGTLHVTEIFAGEMIVSNDEAWDEFMKTYPGKLKVGDIQFASKGLTFPDEKACKERYTSIIKNNKYLHRQIIALLEAWKDKNGGFATMKIDKFVTSEYWKELETGRDSHVGTSIF